MEDPLQNFVAAIS